MICRTKQNIRASVQKKTKKKCASNEIKLFKWSSERRSKFGQINTGCHRLAPMQLALCALAQDAAMNSANSSHLTGTMTSILKL